MPYMDNGSCKRTKREKMKESERERKSNGVKKKRKTHKNRATVTL